LNNLAISQLKLSLLQDKPSCHFYYDVFLNKECY